MFMALGPLINDFISRCRLVIAIYAMYFKEKYKSVLFVVVVKDDNEQIYPVAFGFADGGDCSCMNLVFNKPS